MHDVIVRLIRDGIIINQNQGSGTSGTDSVGNSETAKLGVAVLGRMKLGDT